MSLALSFIDLQLAFAVLASASMRSFSAWYWSFEIPEVLFSIDFGCTALAGSLGVFWAGARVAAPIRKAPDRAATRVFIFMASLLFGVHFWTDRLSCLAQRRRNCILLGALAMMGRLRHWFCRR